MSLSLCFPLIQNQDELVLELERNKRNRSDGSRFREC